MKVRLRPHREPSFHVVDHGPFLQVHVLDEAGDEWMLARYEGHPHLFGGCLVVARADAGRLIASIRRAGISVCFREDDF